jgi:hypothetical protein
MWSAKATNNFFIPQNLTTCFGPYGPSSSDNYRKDIQYVYWMYWMSSSGDNYRNDIQYVYWMYWMSLR